MSRTDGIEYSDVVNGLTPSQIASVPTGASAADPLLLESDGEILTADQKASIPVLASGINPVALASDSSFLTSDEKASIPTGVDADEQLALSGLYVDDLSTAETDVNWTKTAIANTSLTNVGGRFRIFRDAGAGEPVATLNSPIFGYLPISVQAYVNSVIPVNETEAAIELASPVTAANLVSVALGRDAGGNSEINSYVGATLVSTNIALVSGCWLRLVLLGGKLQVFYSTNLEADPPSESDWTAINTFQTVSSLVTPFRLRFYTTNGVGVASTFDFSNLTVQQGVKYVP